MRSSHLPRSLKELGNKVRPEFQCPETMGRALLFLSSLSLPISPRLSSPWQASLGHLNQIRAFFISSSVKALLLYNLFHSPLILGWARNCWCQRVNPPSIPKSGFCHLISQLRAEEIWDTFSGGSLKGSVEKDAPKSS